MPQLDTPITATAESLERVLTKNLPSLLLVYNNSVPAALEGTLKRIAKDEAEKLLVIKVDAANNTTLNQRYDLAKGAPVLVGLQAGKEVARQYHPTANTLETYAEYLLGKRDNLASEAPVTPRTPVHVTDGDFGQQVLQSQGLVLVDFWATWCPPCRAIAPTLEKLAAEFSGRVTIAKLDVDHNPMTPTQYRIQGIPTLILFKNGSPVDRIVGAAPEPMLRQFLQKHL